jgi:hypothetical protein
MYQGFSIEIEKASCFYLSRELIRRGIAPSALPLACVQEIVGKQLEFARHSVKLGAVNVFGVRQDLRQTMAVKLDLEADRIAEALDGNAADWRDRFNASQYESLIDILAKHRVLVS